jgi:acyl-CoA thioester hydrolase
MGHVNHAVYFTYLEQCRLTFWRELTGAPSPYTRVIIARAECDYLSPAVFGDELEIGVAIAEIGRSSFVLAYDVAEVGTGRAVARARTVMVGYDYEQRAPVALPEATRALLERLRG